MQLPPYSLLVTIPHSGEKLPPQATWLKGLPEEILMCDVDRYVDFLYEPSLQKLHLPYAKTEWHRYAGDLNRIPEDVDAGSVEGNSNPAGMHRRGFLWAITTYNHKLMKGPVSAKTHQELVELIYEPFHASVRKLYENYESAGRKKVFHIDAHSMPSVGTKEHRDPGERRAEIVVSDCHGKSCDPRFRDLVIAAYAIAGFKVGFNWPYFGGRVSEHYGQPSKNHHAIQVEMNRDLYMDEVTKKLKPAEAQKIQAKIEVALNYICQNLPNIQN
ncbi:N-formylglutamate amidohydrolase [Bdellovibrio sp. HCB337]|uniref:N-formylglutamate amidohydrolase n=1 Tax=Bdellovibrio sp. HCB337 TaxID=3394358 RepID=UPI0039A5C648